MSQSKNYHDWIWLNPCLSENNCLDIDECENPLNCNKEGFKCKNTPGSFECLCKESFVSVSKMTPAGKKTSCLLPTWSDWTEWSNDCQVDVGRGIRQRSCSVDRDPPACPGPAQEERTCGKYLISYLFLVCCLWRWLWMHLINNVIYWKERQLGNTVE